MYDYELISKKLERRAKLSEGVGFVKDLFVNYAQAFVTGVAWKTFRGPQLPNEYIAASAAVAVPYGIDAVVGTVKNLKEQFTPVVLSSKVFGIASVLSVGALYTYFGGQEALSQLMGIESSTQPYGTSLMRDLVQPVIETSIGFIIGTLAEKSAPAVGNAALPVAKVGALCVAVTGAVIFCCPCVFFESFTNKPKPKSDALVAKQDERKDPLMNSGP